MPHFCSFHIYYANITYFPSPPLELSTIIFIIAKKETPNENQCAKLLSSVEQRNSLKCHFCLSELASIAGICHPGVGGYIHRRVLMAPLRSRKGA